MVVCYLPLYAGGIEVSSGNPLIRLGALGQSVWYDYIRRDLITSGRLQRFIDEDGLRGMTTNPSIFAAAVAEGALYDDDIRAAGLESPPLAVYEAIALRDVQMAADAFRAVWDATGGLDGYVSIEVSPTLAYDTEATLAEARRLWAAADRPNVMIKIPGTEAGLPAIEACLAEGIHINITLLFAVERYAQVMEAYASAMRKRADRGLAVDQAASVASFFVSRVDSAVDALLEGVAAHRAGEAAAAALALRGRAAVANAKVAYAAFEDRFRGAQFAALAAKGCPVQRPLWASTSTKNPAYKDVIYVEELIGPDTVNTVPPETFEAYRDHGDPAVRVRSDVQGARSDLAALADHGIDLAAVTHQLEVEGVQKFAAAFEQLLGTISARQAALRG
jgi:transaldolase